MNAKQFKQARRHTDTPSGLDAAYRRGVALAKSGAGELAMFEACDKCRSADSAKMLRSGYENQLLQSYRV